MRIQSVNTTNYLNNKVAENIDYSCKAKPSFNGKISDAYGRWILKSKGVRSFSKRLSEMDTTNATKHFAVVGALVTASTYAYNTLNNNKLEKKNSTTLAINQALGWIVPTVLGYLMDLGIAEHTKEVEYNFAAKLTKAMHMSNMKHAEYEQALEKTVKQIKGIRTLAGITTFTLFYRYLAPVAITPLANKIGAWVGSKTEAKKENNQVK